METSKTDLSKEFILMDDQYAHPMEQRQAVRSRRYRLIIAVLLVVLTVAYIGAILVGLIPEDRRIDNVSLLIIGLTILVILLLLRPETFSRLKLLELFGFKMELLEEVKQTQEKQGTELESISLILPLLLPEVEQNHLLNLANRRTAGYKAGHTVQNEIRHLRSMGLIKMRPHRTVGQMTDDITFDLADYIELTPLGDRWVSRIRDIEEKRRVG
jgi:hypothetical protein